MGRITAGVLLMDEDGNGVEHLKLELDDTVALVGGEERVGVYARLSDLLPIEFIERPLANGIENLDEMIGKRMKGMGDDAVGTVETRKGVVVASLLGEENAMPCEGETIETDGSIEIGENIV